jgi:transposase
MGQRGRPTAQIVLSDDERDTLDRWARRPTTGQALAMRCRIVLAAESGATNQQIAAEVGCNPTTVGKWRTRFAAKRLDGLMDEPRPGQPRKITDEIVEDVIVTTLEESPPDGSTHWSTRSMAARVGLNQTAISRIWRTFGLKPHRIEDFKLSTDPQFIDKVRDVVGLYLNPPDAAVVLCVDEKTRSKRSIGPRQSCRCCPAPQRAAPTTTSATAPLTSTPPSMSPPARSSPR